MVARWIYFWAILMGILITNTQTSDENCNPKAADITITDSKALKKIEFGRTGNLNTSFLPTPSMIQQGNNLFIKPKFSLGSPFTSYHQGYGSAGADGFLASKVPVPELNAIVEAPETLPFPTLFGPPGPPMIIPTEVANDISIPFPTIIDQPLVPIAIPNLCESLPCPSNVFPIPPPVPQLSMIPHLVEEPVHSVNPVVIPEPPSLPPINLPNLPLINLPNLPPVNLPNLPIQLTVQRPISPTPNNHIIVSSFCPPITRCNNDNDSPMSRIFTEMYEKFKNMLNGSSTNDTSTESVTEEQNSTIHPEAPPEPEVAYPPSCVQTIIAERFLPNVVPNDEIKVYISPISPPQLAHFQYYRK